MAKTLEIKPFLPDTPNWKVMQAIRNVASDEYRRRVPEATQADIQASIKGLTDYPGNWNEFVSQIINKVGLTIAKNRNWTNPLAKFKRGMLEWGDTIEEIQTGLLTAYVYDHDADYGERANFARERPEVQVNYHSVNRENFYKLTVDEVALRRAFLSPTGLAEFINSLMDGPTTSDNWDEYLAMRQLFKEYEDNGGFFKVNVPEIPEDAEAGVEARQALRKIRTWIGKLPFLSDRYNAARMPVHAESAELELFITPEFQSALDVEALAGLFNVSYAEVNSRITIIDEFPEGMEDIKVVLTTRDFFVVADTFYDTRTQPNAAGLYDNHFLHHHQIISVSRFVPAIAFTTGPGTEITYQQTPVTGMEPLSVTLGGVEVDYLERGQSFEVFGSALTTPEGGFNSAIRLTLVGAESSHTYIRNTGKLHVADDDSATEITIRAISVDDPAFEATLELPVTGDRLILWPNPEVIVDTDNDGLGEVTPKEPTREGDTITIPTVTGVQYLSGGTPVKNGGTVQASEAPGTVVTAQARPRFELAQGAPASWTFVAN